MLQTLVVVVNVPQDKHVAMDVESEPEVLVEAGLENLPARDTFDLLRLKAGVTVVLRQELKGLGQLGAGFLRQFAGCLGEAVRVDEGHGFFRLECLGANRPAAILFTSPGA